VLCLWLNRVTTENRSWEKFHLINLIPFFEIGATIRCSLQASVWVRNLLKQVHYRNAFMYTISNTFNNTFCQLPSFSDGETCQNHVPRADMIGSSPTYNFFSQIFPAPDDPFSKNPSSDLLLILLLSPLLSSNNVPSSHKSNSRPFDTFVNPTNCVSS
jgi:hypothetical protein